MGGQKAALKTKRNDTKELVRERLGTRVPADWTISRKARRPECWFIQGPTWPSRVSGRRRHDMRANVKATSRPRKGVYFLNIIYSEVHLMILKTEIEIL